MRVFPRLVRSSLFTLSLVSCHVSSALAADDAALAEIRDQIRHMKAQYESRIAVLEQRLAAAEQRAALPAPAASAPASDGGASRASGNALNPEVSLVLAGTYAHLRQDPEQFRLQGFWLSGGEVGPGARSFSLGESELTVRAPIDPYLSGQMTVALAPDNSVGVEEAFFQTSRLGRGLTLKGGRFLSSFGYQNGQHAHSWDFVDAPLVYQAMFGGQHRVDGAQLRWVAPTNTYLELALEAGRGDTFPGTERNRNGLGSTGVALHLGDDLNASTSWRAGLSYVRHQARERSMEDTDSTGTLVQQAFTGRSHTWGLDGVLKWAPQGSSSRTSFKLQGEYLVRRERGTVTYDTEAASLGTQSGAYQSTQRGWYLQGIYQFASRWRVGLRHERLHAGSTRNELVQSGALSQADFAGLAAFEPRRTSLMLDFSPSEFSRFRIQHAREQTRPGARDSQWFLQYIMHLGAHGAHSY